MNTGNKMIPKEDFDRMDQGLPPRAQKKEVVRPEPKKPIVENQLLLKDFPEDKEMESVAGQTKSIRNGEGCLFTGLNLYVVFRDGTEITGWISDGDFQQLKRQARKSKYDCGIGRILA